MRRKADLGHIAITVVVALILASVGVWASLHSITQQSAAGDYRDGQYAKSRSSYELAQSVTPRFMNPWKILFGIGTNELREQRVADGIATLTDALVHVPKDDVANLPEESVELTYECQVRQNLAIGTEMLGDAHFAAEEWEEAKEKYDEATSIIAHCSNNNQQAEDQSEDTKEKSDQAQQNQDAEEQQQGGGGQDPNDPSDPNDPADPSDPSDPDDPNDPNDPNNQGGGGELTEQEKELQRRGQEGEEEYRGSQWDRQQGDWDGERW